MVQLPGVAEARPTSRANREIAEHVVVAGGRGVAKEVRHAEQIQAHDSAGSKVGTAAHAQASAAARAGRAARGLVAADCAIDDRQGGGATEPGTWVEAVVVDAAAEPVAAVAARAARAADGLVAGDRAAGDG